MYRKRFKTRALSFAAGALAAGVLSTLPTLDVMTGAGLFAGGAAQAADEARPPPPTRSSQTLSQQVYRRIEEVMELRDAEDYAGALEEMGEIRELYDRGRLNEFEVYTMWQFYANIAQLQENYQEALQYYERMVEVPNLTVDRLEQGWYLVASLRFLLEDFRGAIEAYNRHLEISPNPDDDVYLRLGQAYYQLEEYQEAIPYILRNMELLRAQGQQPPESTYSLLRAGYLTVEDYESARDVLREMVVLFNKPDDWNYLAMIEGQLENFENQAYTYYVANAADYLDSESALVNLAAQLSNYENPYTAAQVMQEGMEAGIIEESENNLSFLSQFWQLAREDDRAIAPLERAAEMSDDDAGELYARLGRLQLVRNDWEAAIEAFNRSFDASGELDRPDQVLLQLARAYMELDRYDEALEAARQAATYEQSREDARNWIQVLENRKEVYETLQRNRELYKDYFVSRN